MSDNANPISPQKLDANRANAAKSTGPRTPEGKARSSRNALKHGILAKQILYFSNPAAEDPDAAALGPNESYEDLESLLESLLADKPSKILTGHKSSRPIHWTDVPFNGGTNPG